MKATLLALLLCLGTYTLLLAQDSTASPIYVRVEAGLLNGAGKASTQFMGTASWQLNRYRIGIGAGLDYYRYRSVPVYLAAVRDFGLKKNRPFLYINAGRNYAWPLENQFLFNVRWGGETNRTSFNNGWFADGGLGVRLLARSRPSILLSLGYSIKTLGEDWEEQVFDPGDESIVGVRRSKTYQLNRLVLKFGVDF